jgi:hypothetical protein
VCVVIRVGLLHDQLLVHAQLWPSHTYTIPIFFSLNLSVCHYLFISSWYPAPKASLHLIISQYIWTDFCPESSVECSYPIFPYLSMICLYKSNQLFLELEKPWPAIQCHPNFKLAGDGMYTFKFTLRLKPPNKTRYDDGIIRANKFANLIACF